MVYYSRRQCSNPDDCAAQTPSPTVEKVLHTIAPSSDDHKLLRAYIVLALNLILFAVLARAGYRALMRPRAPPATICPRRSRPGKYMIYIYIASMASMAARRPE